MIRNVIDYENLKYYMDKLIESNNNKINELSGDHTIESYDAICLLCEFNVNISKTMSKIISEVEFIEATEKP